MSPRRESRGSRLRASGGRVLEDFERQAGEAGRRAGAALSRELESALGNLGKGALAGAAAGISTVSPSAATPAHVAARAAVGAASGLAQTAGTALGAAFGGPLGAAVGGVAGQVAGLAVDRFAEGAFRPLERTQARVGSVFGELAAAGFEIQERDVEIAVERVREQEQRRLQAERRVSGLIYSTGSIQDALSFAFQAWR